MLKPKKLKRNVVYIYNAVSVVFRMGNPFGDKLHWLSTFDRNELNFGTLFKFRFPCSIFIYNTKSVYNYDGTRIKICITYGNALEICKFSKKNKLLYN